MGVAQSLRRPLEERFWEKVDIRSQNECWPWKGGRFADGYGAISVDGKPVRAPRVSVYLSNRKIPDGMVIRHRCDNPLCVNPAHLEIGTQSENIADAVARNRNAKNFKVTDEQVAKIRQDNRSHAEIAATFNISRALVALIRGKSGYRGVPAGKSCRKEKYT